MLKLDLKLFYFFCFVFKLLPHDVEEKLSEYRNASYAGWAVSVCANKNDADADVLNDQ